MAGIDLTNQFPNSIMAGAAKNGHSRFLSADAGNPTNLGSEKVLTLNTVGARTRAQLLAAFGYTQEFTFLAFNVTTSTNGVAFTQGGGSLTIAAGSGISLGNADGSALVSDFTITLAAGDVVQVQAAGV